MFYTNLISILPLFSWNFENFRKSGNGATSGSRPRKVNWSVQLQRRADRPHREELFNQASQFAGRDERSVPADAPQGDLQEVRHHDMCLRTSRFSRTSSVLRKHGSHVSFVYIPTLTTQCLHIRIDIVDAERLLRSRIFCNIQSS